MNKFDPSTFFSSRLRKHSSLPVGFNRFGLSVVLTMWAYVASATRSTDSQDFKKLRLLVPQLRSSRYSITLSQTIRTLLLYDEAIFSLTIALSYSILSSYI